MLADAANEAETVYRSKAVGEPPLMLSFSGMAGLARRGRLARSRWVRREPARAGDPRAHPVGGPGREEGEGSIMNELPDWTRSSWQQALAQLDALATPHVLVTIVEAKGSTPRTAGAKMVVAADGQAGSVGGGTLEFEAVETARHLLAEGATRARDRKSDPRRPAGPVLRRHGGIALRTADGADPAPGAVRGRACRAGAGARAGRHRHAHPLVRRTRRSGRSPPVPSGTCLRIVADPVAEVVNLPPDTHVLVMTHSHKRDFEIVYAALTRDDLASIGLIGAKTKWAHFRSPTEEGPSARTNGSRRSACPIGLPNVGGKLPAEIAVSVAAELLSMRAPGPAR